MRTRLLVLIVGLAAVALAAGCGGGGSSSDAGPSPDDVPANAVAIVAGTPISRAEFDRFFKQAEASYEAQGQEFPKAGTADYLKLQGQAVNFLVQRVEFEREADALGIQVTDQDVEKRLQELKDQYFDGDQAKYEAELKKQGLTEADVQADLKAQLLSEKIYDSVTKNDSVTDKQVEDYYNANQDSFGTAASREVAHILVDKKALADRIYAELQDGGDFTELAKKYSTDTASAKNGGVLTDEKGQFVPEFEKVAFALKTGEIGEPVKSQYGWHVIKALKDTVPARTQDLSEVETTIRDQLLTDKKNKTMTSWVSDLQTKYGSQIAYAVGFEPVAASTGAGVTSP